MAFRLGSPRAIPTLLAVLAMGSTGCGGSLDSGGTGPGDSGGVALDSGAPGSDVFPLGTYTGCVQGLYDDSLNGAGFQDGAVLTLTRSGDTVTAAYVDQNGVASSFDFAQTTSVSATLAPTGQTAPGFSNMCVEGPGDEGFYPAVMTAGAGELTYDQGMVFVALGGVLQDDAGPCGAQSNPAGYWLLCENRQGGPPSPAPSGAASGSSPPQLPAGVYACTSQVETYDSVNGTNEYVASGDEGTLVLSQNGADVNAAYTGDRAIDGALLFTATTTTTARAQMNQTLATTCTAPLAATGVPSGPPVSLPLAAGSLSVAGGMLFVSFAGTMDASSGCSGAQVAGSLVCTKQ